MFRTSQCPSSEGLYCTCTICCITPYWLPRSESGRLHSPGAVSLRHYVQYPLNRRMGGPQGRTGRCWAQIKSLFFTVIEPGSINRSVRCQAVTGCYWLSYTSSESDVWSCKSCVYVCLLNCVSCHSLANVRQCSSDNVSSPVIPPLLHTHSPITDATVSQQLPV
jgi:hypothetical protein